MMLILLIMLIMLIAIHFCWKRSGWATLSSQSNTIENENQVDPIGRRNPYPDNDTGSNPHHPSDDKLKSSTGHNPSIIKISGGKRKSKGKSKKVAKKPVVSQKKQSIYKEILGKQMKIYKMPDSRKEYVKYKGDLLHISDYKDLMKQKALAKSKPKSKK